MDDLISRQAAIEAMSESLKRVFPEHRQIAEKCLNVLPSAQEKPFNLPEIYIAEGYDTIEGEDGNVGFGVYVPDETKIYVAGDVEGEIRARALFHEVCHWVQAMCGRPFDEDEANEFSDIVYDALPSAQPEPSEITDEQAILHLQSTGWMQNHDREMYENGLRERLADDSGSYDSLVPCDDTISRQAAIDAIKDLPSAQDEIAKAVAAVIEQPEIIRCKDCKHRPYKSEDQQGFGVEFPDETCPCQCEDGWYNWRPDDDWFCANADMRGEHE